jgi:hypothetical protein
MNRNKLVILAVVIVLLIAGFIIYRVINADTGMPVDQNGFRAWFWEHRGLDLVVHVLLVFAGALGIAAILPREEEHD